MKTLKSIAAFVLATAVVVCALASSAPAATGNDHPREPIACIKTGAACTGYGCCSHNCVQSRCQP